MIKEASKEPKVGLEIRIFWVSHFRIYGFLKHRLAVTLRHHRDEGHLKIYYCKEGIFHLILDKF